MARFHSCLEGELRLLGVGGGDIISISPEFPDSLPEYRDIQSSDIWSCWFRYVGTRLNTMLPPFSSQYALKEKFSWSGRVPVIANLKTCWSTFPSRDLVPWPSPGRRPCYLWGICLTHRWRWGGGPVVARWHPAHEERSLECSLSGSQVAKQLGNCSISRSVQPWGHRKVRRVN